jgi:hypothetical protein
MSVEVRHIEETDDYELGAEIDGHWIHFARVPGEQVRTTVENKQAQADAAAQEPGAQS